MVFAVLALAAKQDQANQRKKEPSNRRWYGAWDQDKEYRYQVRSRTLAALPDLKDQW